MATPNSNKTSSTSAWNNNWEIKICWPNYIWQFDIRIFVSIKFVFVHNVWFRGKFIPNSTTREGGVFFFENSEESRSVSTTIFTFIRVLFQSYMSYPWHPRPLMFMSSVLPLTWNAFFSRLLACSQTFEYSFFSSPTPSISYEIAGEFIMMSVNVCRMHAHMWPNIPLWQLLFPRPTYNYRWHKTEHRRASSPCLHFPVFAFFVFCFLFCSLFISVPKYRLYADLFYRNILLYSE